jgi:uncharacterized protein
MKRVFLIHGYEGTPNGGWRPWVMGELAKHDIFATALTMPGGKTPHLSEWIAEIARNVETGVKGDVYLVGHSLGVPAILKYVEQTPLKKIAGIVLVSGPSLPTKKKAVAEFLAEEFNFHLIKSKVAHITVIHGDNDPVVHVNQAHFLVDSLGVRAKLIKNGKHLNGSAGFTKLPAVVNAILTADT